MIFLSKRSYAKMQYNAADTLIIYSCTVKKTYCILPGSRSSETSVNIFTNNFRNLILRVFSVVYNILRILPAKKFTVFYLAAKV